MEFSSISTYEEFIEYSKAFIHDAFVSNGDCILYSLFGIIFCLLLYVIFVFIKTYVVTFCKSKLHPEKKYDESLKQFSKYKRSVIGLCGLIGFMFYTINVIIEKHKEDVFTNGKIIFFLFYSFFNIYYYVVLKYPFDFFDDVKIIYKYLIKRNEINRKEIDNLMTKKLN